MARKDRQHTVALATKKDSTKPPVDTEGAVLVHLYPPGAGMGRRVELGKGEHVVGRLGESEITVDADSVSRRHARLMRHPKRGWCVEDLGSTNGTYVNDHRVDELTPLGDGDQLRFGGAIFKFLSGSNIESAYHEEIYRMSIVDGLTGVHNKRYFVDFLERELAGAARHQLPLSLVLFDLDHFKNINDSYGHLAGDAVLKEICRRLRPRIRREDLLARYGGEEFVCVLTKTGVAGAATFAEAIRDLVSKAPVDWDGRKIDVTVSLGVATFESSPAIAADAFIKQADDRMYEAKRAGRNRVVA